MRVNISNHTITSIDFGTIDQVIDFIKKFNEQSYSQGINVPFIYNPTPNCTPTNPNSPWYTITCANYDDFISHTQINSEGNNLCSNPNK